MLKQALWGALSILLAAGIGCGDDSTLSVEPVREQADAEASSISPADQTSAQDAASYAEYESTGVQPAMTVLPASVEWPIPSSDDGSTAAASDDAPIAKTIYIDITWDENYKYIFEFDGPLTVPAGKKVRFVVTNTFTDPDECW